MNDSLVTSITRPLGLGRNTLRGPNIYQFDLRYTRTLFTLKERFRAQFLTEAANVFNHPNVTSLKTGGVVVDTTGCPKTVNGFTLDPRIVDKSAVFRRASPHHLPQCSRAGFLISDWELDGKGNRCSLVPVPDSCAGESKRGDR